MPTVKAKLSSPHQMGFCLDLEGTISHFSNCTALFEKEFENEADANLFILAHSNNFCEVKFYINEPTINTTNEPSAKDSKSDGGILYSRKIKQAPKRNAENSNAPSLFD